MASGSRLRAIIKDIAIIAAAILIIWVSLTVVFGTQNPFYVVSSGSMIPALQVYDVIVVQGNDPFEEVEIGDIIVFDRPAGHDRVIVHRVEAIIDDDPLTIRTKGDANPSSMPGTDFPITAEEYIGTVAYVIPQVGFVTRLFATQIGGIPLNYIIIAIIIGMMVAKQVKNQRRPKPDSVPREYGSDGAGGGPDPGTDELELDGVLKDPEYAKRGDPAGRPDGDVEPKPGSEPSGDETGANQDEEDRKQ